MGEGKPERTEGTAPHPFCCAAAVLRSGGSSDVTTVVPGRKIVFAPGEWRAGIQYISSGVSASMSHCQFRIVAATVPAPREPIVLRPQAVGRRPGIRAGDPPAFALSRGHARPGSPLPSPSPGCRGSPPDEARLIHCTLPEKSRFTAITAARRISSPAADLRQGPSSRHRRERPCAISGAPGGVFRNGNRAPGSRKYRPASAVFPRQPARRSRRSMNEALPAPAVHEHTQPTMGLGDVRPVP